MIHFVGAGCGAADLITLRGKALLERADVIIYAGSLVNPALLEYKNACLFQDVENTLHVFAYYEHNQASYLLQEHPLHLFLPQSYLQR